MDRDPFIKVLNGKGYKWREEGEWIIVERTGYVNLNSLKSIPDNVQFNDGGDVYLRNLETIPDNVEFNNGGFVYLDSLKSMGNNVKFNNTGYVNLRSLESIPINSDIDEMFTKCKNIYIKEGLINNIHFPDSRWKSVKEMLTN